MAQHTQLYTSKVVTYEGKSEVVAKELLDALSSVEEGKQQKIKVKPNSCVAM